MLRHLEESSGSGVIDGKKTTFFSHFLVPDCRCTRMSQLYPIVTVPVCRTTCTCLSLYPTVAYPCTRLSPYPTVANFCTRLSLYPTVASVPVCHCTQLSLYPTVAVPNCPRTRLSGTGKINDTKNAISHELLGLDLEQNFKKENSWFCMLQAVAAINKKYNNFEFFSAVPNSRKQVIFSNNYFINKWV